MLADVLVPVRIGLSRQLERLGPGLLAQVWRVPASYVLGEVEIVRLLHGLGEVESGRVIEARRRGAVVGVVQRERIRCEDSDRWNPQLSVGREQRSYLDQNVQFCQIGGKPL